MSNDTDSPVTGPALRRMLERKLTALSISDFIVLSATIGEQIACDFGIDDTRRRPARQRTTMLYNMRQSPALKTRGAPTIGR